MKTVHAKKRSVAEMESTLYINKSNVFKKIWKTRFYILLILPALIFYILFCYVPMWGLSVGFYDYNAYLGLEGSKFVGLKHFKVFFNSPDAWRLTKNTLILGFQQLLIAFPTNIIFALLLNEIRNMRFKKVVQTVSYMPHFLSTVVVCSLVTSLLDPYDGGINQIIKLFGGEAIYFASKPEWFRPIYLISGIWQGVGWASIVYLAAISGVDPALYEAAKLDGASRFRQTLSITLPSILPTVATMFILQIGSVMGASMEKVLLLQTNMNREVSDILSTYIYEKGLGNLQFGFTTAIGLYTNVVNLALLLFGNWASKKLSGEGIF